MNHADRLLLIALSKSAAAAGPTRINATTPKPPMLSAPQPPAEPSLKGMAQISYAHTQPQAGGTSTLGAAAQEPVGADWARQLNHPMPDIYPPQPGAQPAYAGFERGIPQADGSLAGDAPPVQTSAPTPQMGHPVAGNMDPTALWHRFGGGSFDPHSAMDRFKLQNIMSAHGNGNPAMLAAGNVPFHPGLGKHGSNQHVDRLLLVSTLSKSAASLVGAGIGAATAPSGHRLEGAGRGGFTGMGTDLGIGVGSQAGGWGGLGVSALLAKLLNKDPETAALMRLTGTSAGVGLGAIGGGIAGGRTAHNIMGEPSWGGPIHGAENKISDFLSSVTGHKHASHLFIIGMRKQAASLLENGVVKGVGLLGKNLFNLGTRQVGKTMAGAGEMLGGGIPKLIGGEVLHMPGAAGSRMVSPATSLTNTGFANRLFNRGTSMVDNASSALKSNVDQMPGWAQGVSRNFNRGMNYTVPGKLPLMGGWNPMRSTLNPFSMQNMMFGDLNPLHKLPGIGGAYNFTSTIPRKEGEQEGAYNAAAQFAHTAENMPMMQRLGFLFNPTGLREQLPPEVLQRMQQMYPQQQG